MSYSVASSELKRPGEERKHRVWQFATSGGVTSVDPYSLKTLRVLLNASGTLYKSQESVRALRKTQYSCLYEFWCYFWDVPHILLSLQGFVLYFYGMCDLLYLLFAVIPLNVVLTRRRYKKWHEDGRGMDSLRQPSQNIPVPEKEVKKYDFMIFMSVVNTVIASWVWAACTLWIPLLWIESASAARLSLSLKILVQCIEISAWASGPFAFFAFFHTSFAVSLAFYVKYHQLVKRTTSLINKFNNNNYNMKENELEIQTFVEECIPHHMEICRSMHKYSSSTSMSHFINVCGVIWLIGMCYINAFVLKVENENAWWYVRPWTTLGFFTFAFFQVLMPFALLSSKTVEYIRVTETCLGSIAAYCDSGVLDVHGEDISEVARRELNVFTVVQNLSFIRIMGMPVQVETVTKLFYVLAVLFILPLVTTSA